jgi:hypothetical protein
MAIQAFLSCLISIRVRICRSSDKIYHKGRLSEIRDVSTRTRFNENIVAPDESGKRDHDERLVFLSSYEEVPEIIRGRAKSAFMPVRPIAQNAMSANQKRRFHFPE